MKKKLLITLLIMFLTSVCFAPWNISYRNVSNPRILTRMLQDKIGTLDDQVATLQGQQSGLFSNIGTGDVWYVDSATGSDTDTGATWALATETLDAAIALCANANHDVIYVASGHSETINTVTLDISDITIIGIGSGVDMPEFIFNATSDEFIIDAQGVTVYNLRFLATIADIVNAFDLQDGSDYATIIGCEFPEPAAATHEFILAFALTTGADNVTIAYNTFTNIGATPGCTAFIDGGALAIDGLSVIGNVVKASMLVAGIFSDKADTNLFIANNTITNTDADQHAIELTLTAKGIIANNLFFCDDLDTMLDPGSCGLFENYGSTSVDQTAVLIPLAEIPEISGNVWYVDDGGTDAVTHGRSWQAPFDTIDYASAACTANQGDIIYVQAGHSTTLAATPITLAENGITIIGLGEGTNRPNIIFGNDLSSIDVTGTNVTIKNFIFQSATATTSIGVDVDAADFTMENCTFKDTGDFEFKISLDLGTTADRAVVKNCVFTTGGASTGATSCIAVTGGAADDLTIEDCFIFGDFTNAAIYSTTANLRGLIKNCEINNQNTGNHAIELTGLATGSIVDCSLYGDTPSAVLDPGSMKCFNNFISTGVDGESIAVPFTQVTEIAGSVFFVDSTAAGKSDAATHGGGWKYPFATLNYAVAACASDNGDIIYVSPGHVLALADGAVTFDVDGVKIIGLGVGTDRPTITFAHGNSSIVISADDFMIKNFIFSSITATTDETIDVTGPGVILEDCTWIETGDFEHVISVTLDAAAEYSTIRNCDFYGAGTGATSAISIVGGVIDHLVIEGCRIWGDFTDAAIQSDQINTNALIRNNVITNRNAGNHAIQLSDDTTGELVNNMLYANTITAILDPGDMKCFGNRGQIATDIASFEIPGSVLDVVGNILGVNDASNLGVTDTVTEDTDGSVVERLEFLQAKSDDILAALQIAGTGIGNVYYLDDIGGLDTYDGTTWEKAEKTFAAALGDVTTNTGSIIFVAPNHVEDFAGAIAANKIDTTVIGLGVGDSRPTFTFSAGGSVVNVSVADMKFKNLIFANITADSTVGFALAAGADSTVFEDCEFRSSGAFEFVDTITMASGTDDLTIRRCKFNNATVGVGTATSAITNTSGVCDGMVIEDSEFYGAWLEAVIEIDQVDTDVMIRNNIFYQTSAGIHAIEFSDNALGSLIGNVCYADTAGTVIDPGYLKCTENYSSSAVDVSGVLDPGPAASIDIAGNLLGVDDASNLGTTANVTEDIDGSALERLEHLKIVSDDILAALHIAGEGIGDVWYVDSVGGSDATGDGTTWELAEASLAVAYAQSVTDTGSVIFLAPNHAETLLSAGSIAINEIDVTIIGLGSGDSRPIFSLSETASSIDVSAADNKFKNIIFRSITADSTICFSLAAGADGTTFEDCVFDATGGGIEFLSAITLAAGADDVTIKGCKFTNTSTQATEAIQGTAGATNRLTIEDCEFYGAWTAAAIYSNQVDLDVMIRNNVVSNSSTGAHAIEFSGNALGSLINNMLYTDSYAAMLDPGYLKCYGNMQSIGTDRAAIDVPLVAGKAYSICKTDGDVLNADDPTFVIANGPIEILGLYGEVTTVLVGASNCTIFATDTASGTQVAISSAVAIDADADGTTYIFEIGAVPVLTPVLGAQSSAVGMVKWLIMPGTIEVHNDAAQTGEIAWYMVFRPLTENVVVSVAP